MRGMPKFIQTPADLNNLSAIAQTGEIDKGELIEKINALLARQYFHTPILSIDGNTVTTRYFSEVTVDSTTAEGLTVTAVDHFTPSEDETDENSDTTPTETEITLSGALAAGSTVLSIYMPVNFLTQNGFNVTDINNILEVLING